MKRLILAAMLLLGPLVVGGLGRTPAGFAPSPAPEGNADALLDLLPDSSLVAVEIRDLERRWSALRSIPILAEVQDRILVGSGLEPDDLPILAGNRAAVALVPAPEGRGVVPVAVLRPDDLDRAEAILDRRAGARRASGAAWCRVRDRGALWVGPSSAAGDVAAIARGDGTSLGPLLPFDEAAARLPAGGLARGWIHPAGVRRFLREAAPGTRAAPAELIAAALAAELDAARWIAFRRDVTGGRIVTDAALVYDRSKLPEAVARVFDPGAPASRLPEALPPDVVLAAAWRPEPEACLPWLRFLEAADDRGPFRNLDFWIEEFEERSGRNLERDLFGELGDHAWTLVLDEGDSGLGPVTVFEVRDARRVEATVLDLRDWLADYVGAQTMGLANPVFERSHHRGVVIHDTRFRSVLGSLTVSSVATSGTYLVVGVDGRGVRTALDLIAEGRFDRTGSVAFETGPRAHLEMVVRGPALAGALARSGGETEGDPSGLRGGPLAAAIRLLEGVPEATVRVRYTPDGLDVHGEVPLSAAETSP